MKLRFVILMILLVFNCSTSWCEESEVAPPSTGNRIDADTAVVAVPICIIKDANIKLHERIILKDIVMNQDKEVKELKTLNAKYKVNIDTLNVINERLRKENIKLTKSNAHSNIVIIAETAAIVGMLLYTICH